MPDNLKPDVPGADTREVSGTAASAQTAKKPAKTYLAGPGQNPGGAAAVTVQANESRISASVAPFRGVEGQGTRRQGTPAQTDKLSDEDRARIAELRARDREVRTHEAAHAATGQGYAGRPQYEFVRGPDGVQYAVGGHVSIDTQAVADNPAATIEKMQVVQAAALAPARPSGQDRAVAAKAAAAIREAEADLRSQKGDSLGAYITSEATASAETAATQTPPARKGNYINLIA